MKQIIKNIVKKVIILIAKTFRIEVFFEKTKLPAYIDIIENKYGHKISREKGIPLNSEYKPLPWFTYPAIEYLNQLDLSGCTVFEWGSGNSSLFFAQNSKFVYSIENNKEWFEKILKYKLFNNTIELHEDLDDYVNAISKINIKFDIIVIDGRERRRCAEISHFYLKKNGLIILDNSDRSPDIAEKFRKLGLLQVDMHGLGPINNYTWTTTFFFKGTFAVKPKNVQPVIPIGGGY